MCASPVPLVIACGGGAVLDPGNRRRAAGDERRRVAPGRGPTPWRSGSADDAENRPLLKERGAAATLALLDVLRAPAYEAAAHATVETEGRSVDEVAAAVLEEFARCDA